MRKEKPCRVLALDIEGGYGGSSRSLFHLVRHVDPADAAVEVWCKREGPIQEAYGALDITCHVEPEMPKVSALPRFSRNVYMHLKFFAEFKASKEFRTRLATEIYKRFDVVHCNHESLAWLAAWLRSRIDAAIVVHNRTMLWPSLFSRMQMVRMDRAADRLVFITENEESNLRKLGAKSPGKVIYNVVEVPKESPEPHEALAGDSRFKVCCLSNYSWMRGVDRMVDVAEELKKRSRTDVLLVLAGEMNLTRSLPGELGQTAASGGDLKEYARKRGLSGSILFLGHVSEPERVLAACDALAKPTREANPWGRDILEAMALGKPVLSCGTYDRFVSEDETGYLLPEFSVDAFSDRIIRLADNRDLAQSLGARARLVVQKKCNGGARASDLVKLWGEAVESKQRFS